MPVTTTAASAGSTTRTNKATAEVVSTLIMMLPSFSAFRWWRDASTLEAEGGAFRARADTSGTSPQRPREGVDHHTAHPRCRRGWAARGWVVPPAGSPRARSRGFPVTRGYVGARARRSARVPRVCDCFRRPAPLSAARGGNPELLRLRVRPGSVSWWSRAPTMPPWQGWTLTVMRVALGLVWVYAGVPKFTDVSQTLRALRAYQLLPEPLVIVAASALFNDAQGRSYVIAYDDGGPAPSCPDRPPG